jgi:ubiquinone/menaquinone biosynthesis C-methylase UbiE
VFLRKLFERTPAESEADAFLGTLYRILLKRTPDPSGRNYFKKQLVAGLMTREQVAEAIFLSAEFQKTFASRFDKYDASEVFFDFVQLTSPEPFLPFVTPAPFTQTQLIELVNPRKWLDPEWRKLQVSLRIVNLSFQGMHRKTFEWVQTLFGCSSLGRLGDGHRFLGVGCGHEPIVYWLSNHSQEMVATDLYEGDWTRKEGDPTVLENNFSYAPFEFNPKKLKFLKMDARDLLFKDETFDVVFSISSVEHFGGHQESARAAREMARVLKPGGLLVIATEVILNQKNHAEFFRFEELIDYIIEPSGMKLIQSPVFELPRFALEHPSLLPDEKDKTPCLVCLKRGVLFTSVILFLKKD